MVYRSISLHSDDDETREEISYERWLCTLFGQARTTQSKEEEDKTSTTNVATRSILQVPIRSLGELVGARQAVDGKMVVRRRRRCFFERHGRTVLDGDLVFFFEDERRRKEETAAAVGADAVAAQEGSICVPVARTGGRGMDHRAGADDDAVVVVVLRLCCCSIRRRRQGGIGSAGGDDVPFFGDEPNQSTRRVSSAVQRLGVRVVAAGRNCCDDNCSGNDDDEQQLRKVSPLARAVRRTRARLLLGRRRALRAVDGRIEGTGWRRMEAVDVPRDDATVPVGVPQRPKIQAKSSAIDANEPVVVAARLGLARRGRLRASPGMRRRPVDANASRYRAVRGRRDGDDAFTRGNSGDHVQAGRRRVLDDDSVLPGRIRPSRGRRVSELVVRRRDGTRADRRAVRPVSVTTPLPQQRQRRK